MDRNVAARETGANATVVERVLDAERNVELRVQAAVDEAARVVRAARARADGIRVRTDERISRLHVAVESRLERQIAAMRREFLETEESPTTIHSLVSGAMSFSAPCAPRCPHDWRGP